MLSRFFSHHRIRLYTTKFKIALSVIMIYKKYKKKGETVNNYNKRWKKNFS